MKIIKLHNCIHIFDPQEDLYRKSSTSNLHQALGASYAHLTRTEILAQINWPSCQSPNCKVRCCKDGTHLIGSKRFKSPLSRPLKEKNSPSK